jgi:hypothetical protein
MSLSFEEQLELAKMLSLEDNDDHSQIADNDVHSHIAIENAVDSFCVMKGWTRRNTLADGNCLLHAALGEGSDILKLDNDFVVTLRDLCADSAADSRVNPTEVTNIRTTRFWLTAEVLDYLVKLDMYSGYEFVIYQFHYSVDGVYRDDIHVNEGRGKIVRHLILYNGHFERLERVVAPSISQLRFPAASTFNSLERKRLQDEEAADNVAMITAAFGK